MFPRKIIMTSQIQNVLRDCHIRKDYALTAFQVLCVGVVKRRYVLFEYARPWLIHAFKNVKGRHTGVSAAINDSVEDIVNLGDELPLPAYYPQFARPHEKTETLKGKSATSQSSEKSGASKNEEPSQSSSGFQSMGTSSESSLSHGNVTKQAGETPEDNSCNNAETLLKSENVSKFPMGSADAEAHPVKSSTVELETSQEDKEPLQQPKTAKKSTVGNPTPTENTNSLFKTSYKNNQESDNLDGMCVATSEEITVQKTNHVTTLSIAANTGIVTSDCHGDVTKVITPCKVVSTNDQRSACNTPVTEMKLRRQEILLAESGCLEMLDDTSSGDEQIIWQKYTQDEVTKYEDEDDRAISPQSPIQTTPTNTTLSPQSISDLQRAPPRPMSQPIGKPVSKVFVSPPPVNRQSHNDSNIIYVENEPDDSANTLFVKQEDDDNDREHQQQPSQNMLVLNEEKSVSNKQAIDTEILGNISDQQGSVISQESNSTQQVITLSGPQSNLIQYVSGAGQDQTDIHNVYHHDNIHYVQIPSSSSQPYTNAQVMATTTISGHQADHIQYITGHSHTNIQQPMIYTTAGLQHFNTKPIITGDKNDQFMSTVITQPVQQSDQSIQQEDREKQQGSGNNSGLLVRAAPSGQILQSIQQTNTDQLNTSSVTSSVVQQQGNVLNDSSQISSSYMPCFMKHDKGSEVISHTDSANEYNCSGDINTIPPGQALIVSKTPVIEGNDSPSTVLSGRSIQQTNVLENQPVKRLRLHIPSELPNRSSQLSSVPHFLPTTPGGTTYNAQGVRFRMPKPTTYNAQGVRFRMPKPKITLDTNTFLPRVQQIQQPFVSPSSNTEVSQVQSDTKVLEAAVHSSETNDIHEPTEPVSLVVDKIQQSGDHNDSQQTKSVVCAAVNEDDDQTHTAGTNKMDTLQLARDDGGSVNVEFSPVALKHQQNYKSEHIDRIATDTGGYMSTSRTVKKENSVSSRGKVNLQILSSPITTSAPPAKESNITVNKSESQSRAEFIPQPTYINVSHKIVSTEFEDSISDEELEEVKEARKRIKETYALMQSNPRARSAAVSAMNVRGSGSLFDTEMTVSETKTNTFDQKQDVSVKPLFTVDMNPNANKGQMLTQNVSSVGYVNNENNTILSTQQTQFISSSSAVNTSVPTVSYKTKQATDASSTATSSKAEAPLVNLEPFDLQKHLKTLVEISGSLKTPIKLRLPPRVSLPVTLGQTKIKVVTMNEAKTLGLVSKPTGSSVVTINNTSSDLTEPTVVYQDQGISDRALTEGQHLRRANTEMTVPSSVVTQIPHGMVMTTQAYQRPTASSSVPFTQQIDTPQSYQNVANVYSGPIQHLPKQPIVLKQRKPQVTPQTLVSPKQGQVSVLKPQLSSSGEQHLKQPEIVYVQQGSTDADQLATENVPNIKQVHQQVIHGKILPLPTMFKHVKKSLPQTRPVPKQSSSLQKELISVTKPVNPGIVRLDQIITSSSTSAPQSQEIDRDAELSNFLTSSSVVSKDLNIGAGSNPDGKVQQYYKDLKCSVIEGRKSRKKKGLGSQSSNSEISKKDENVLKILAQFRLEKEEKKSDSPPNKKPTKKGHHPPQVDGPPDKKRKQEIQKTARSSPRLSKISNKEDDREMGTGQSTGQSEGSKVTRSMRSSPRLQQPSKSKKVTPEKNKKTPKQISKVTRSSPAEPPVDQVKHEIIEEKHKSKKLEKPTRFSSRLSETASEESKKVKKKKKKKTLLEFTSQVSPLLTEVKTPTAVKNISSKTQKNVKEKQITTRRSAIESSKCLTPEMSSESTLECKSIIKPSTSTAFKGVKTPTSKEKQKVLLKSPMAKSSFTEIEETKNIVPERKENQQLEEETLLTCASSPKPNDRCEKEQTLPEISDSSDLLSGTIKFVDTQQGSKQSTISPKYPPEQSTAVSVNKTENVHETKIEYSKPKITGNLDTETTAVIDSVPESSEPAKENCLFELSASSENHQIMSSTGLSDSVDKSRSQNFTTDVNTKDNVPCEVTITEMTEGNNDVNMDETTTEVCDTVSDEVAPVSGGRVLRYKKTKDTDKNTTSVAAPRMAAGQVLLKPQRHRKTVLPPPTGTYMRVRVIPRPWKTPEGTVNRPVLRMMIEGILMYIMTQPGLTVKALFDKYTPILQPVVVLELVDMLQELGCITQTSVKLTSKKPSLFSGRRQVIKEMNQDSEESVENMILHPTIDCILKMGQFIHQVIQ